MAGGLRPSFTGAPSAIEVYRACLRLVLSRKPSTSLPMTDSKTLPPEHLSEIVQMALSDHVSFADIEQEYGLGEAQVKALMRDSLRPGSYRAWRKRVRAFSDRRAQYK